MPFREQLTIELVATSERALEARFSVEVEPRAWDDASLHFYAAYHAPDLQSSEPTHDLRLAELRGRGALAGVALNVINESPSWWGEGDEKILRSTPMPFPTHFGTGTEDYFGYAYCSNETFTTPFIGQPRAGARRNFGAISLYRLHVLDSHPVHERAALRSRGQPLGRRADAHGLRRDRVLLRAPGRPGRRRSRPTRLLIGFRR